MEKEQRQESWEETRDIKEEELVKLALYVKQLNVVLKKKMYDFHVIYNKRPIAAQIMEE